MVTVKDIAEKVGVSATTVSIVINGKSEERGITRATQEKILSAMRELGYQPNLSARRLRSREGAPAVIAFFWPTDFRLSILASFLNAFSARIRETGFNCQLVVQTYDNDRLKEFDSVFTSGIYHALVIGACSQADLMHLESLQPTVPVVLINRDSERYPTVGFDNDAMGKLAAELFLKKGYREAAVFASRQGFLASNRRVEAFLRSCELDHISILPAQLYRDDSSADGGYRMGSRFAESPNRPRAIFCDNDAIAFGALRSLRENGIWIPEDLELLTVDITSTELTAHAYPPLSVVRLPTDKVGAQVIDLLRTMLSNPAAEPVHILVEPELILRESFTAD